eukprot:22399-Pelagomonas_calceolata.AAC.1
MSDVQPQAHSISPNVQHFRSSNGFGTSRHLDSCSKPVQEPTLARVCTPFTKRDKRKKSMGIRRITSSSPCLILVTRVER